MDVTILPQSWRISWTRKMEHNMEAGLVECVKVALKSRFLFVLNPKP